MPLFIFNHFLTLVGGNRGLSQMMYAPQRPSPRDPGSTYYTPLIVRLSPTEQEL